MSRQVNLRFDHVELRLLLWLVAAEYNALAPCQIDQPHPCHKLLAGRLLTKLSDAFTAAEQARNSRGESPGGER